MRVFYISNSFIPSNKANSIQVMKMCQAFSRLVGEVVLFCRKSGEQGVDNIFQYYGVADSFEVRRLEVPKVRMLSRFMYAREIMKQIRRESGPSLVYGRDYYVMGLMCLMGINLPMSLEIHQPPEDRVQAALQGIIFRHKSFRRLVVISQALADEYVRLYGKDLEGKISVAHDGADFHQIPTQMLSNPTYEYKGDRFRLGYIGSLYPGKGMEMIARLAPLAPEHEFHVVGGTPEEVARWKSEVPADNLVFYGFVSPDKVYDYMGTFDAMLAPFQPNVLVGDRKVDIARWMSPLKIFEYMAGGKPIIASNLPVLQEVLTDNENALLTDAADPHGWVAKINRLADDEALRRKLGQQAQKDFFSHYTWEKRAEILLHTLQPRQTIREKVQGITTPNR